MADQVERFTSAQAIQKATLEYFSLFLSEPTAEVASRLVKQVCDRFPPLHLLQELFEFFQLSINFERSQYCC